MTPKTSLRFLLIIVLLALIPGTVDAAQPIPLPLDVQVAGDDFGQNVAVDGDTAIIGAATGVYIYVRNGTTWSQQAKLEASTGVQLKSETIDGDTAIASGRVDNSSAAKGALYVFVRNGTTWTEQAKLTVTRNYEVHFPGIVALDGDLIMTGNQFYMSGNIDDPSFVGYGFVRTGTVWSEAHELWAGGETDDNHMALNGNTAALFNNQHVDWYNPDSTIYLYNYTDSSGWEIINTLHSPFPVDAGNPDLAGAFSRKVAVSDDTLVVSGLLYKYSTSERFYDVLFVFTRSGNIWTQQAIIAPVNNRGHHYDLYLATIALDGDTLILDVPDPDTAIWSELIYVHANGSWTPQAIIPGSRSGFRSIALSGNTLLQGIASPDAAAYVFFRSGAVWSQQAKLILPGVPGELLANGGFEGVITGYSVGGWKLRGTSARRDYEIFHNGYASFKFNYSTEKILQDVDLNQFNLKTGDKIRLTGFYNKLSASSYKADVWLYISYANLPEDQLHITVQKPTAGWQTLPKLAATLKAKPTRIRVVIQAAADDNQYIYFDDLSLKLVTPALKANQTSELLPLP